MSTDLKIEDKIEKKKAIVVEAVKAAVVSRCREKNHVLSPQAALWESGGSLLYKNDLCSLETASCLTE